MIYFLCRTTGGVHVGKSSITAPPIMWIKALDLLFEKLRLAGLDFSTVAAISGAAQGCFTVGESPVWMDSSTTLYCNQLEENIGGPETLSSITGSKAFERFTVNHINKLFHTKPEVYTATEGNISSYFVERYGFSPSCNLISFTGDNPDVCHETLAASYAGSPRHMHEYAQDAMTYVRTYGRPDLFLTFTCNPAWAEIKNLLLPGQQSSHRHDLTARVFKQKLKCFIDLIVKNHIYGPTRCWMYSIEWQKIGTPHAHILIWLEEKILSTQIDNIISAELPDPQEDPELYQIIKNINFTQHGSVYWKRNANDILKNISPEKFLYEQLQGNISSYFVERYGFSPSCNLISFTGDNPAVYYKVFNKKMLFVLASLAGMRLEPGDIAVSLGTSDTVFVWLTTPETSKDGHIFIILLIPQHIWGYF
ncbi:hypothetical protein LAZ67_X000459, partial [Cordylochernes scorpioides]